MHPLIVGLNPSVDVEWRVPSVRWGEKNEIRSERRWPGGKGVNVARWLKHLGLQPRLLLPLGGRNGEEMAAGLQAERLSTVVFPIRGQTRANIIVTGPPEGQLRFNPLGPELSQAEWRQLQALVRRELQSASLLVLSGSLPRGLESNAYSDLIRMAARDNVRCVLDCDGNALSEAVPAKPFLAKPNHHELAAWFGRPLNNPQHIENAAFKLSAKTRGWVLVSTGADGGHLVQASSNTCIRVRPPGVVVHNTVGAGDAQVAAIVQQIAAKEPPEKWIRAGVATGTAAATCAAGTLPSRSLIRRMRQAVQVVKHG
jgi:1-phosphofructokinase family hexose kinase